jgi:hypothetical protein
MMVTTCAPSYNAVRSANSSPRASGTCIRSSVTVQHIVPRQAARFRSSRCCRAKAREPPREAEADRAGVRFRHARAQPAEGADQGAHVPNARAGRRATGSLGAAPRHTVARRTMAQTRRDRKLGRWGRETALREGRLDEVPAEGLNRIVLPAHDVPASQLPVTAEAASLAVSIRQLRQQLKRARWIPWQRRRRPQLQAQIDELIQNWRALRADGAGRGRRL